VWSPGCLPTVATIRLAFGRKGVLVVVLDHCTIVWTPGLKLNSIEAFQAYEPSVP